MATGLKWKQGALFKASSCASPPPAAGGALSASTCPSCWNQIGTQAQGAAVLKGVLCGAGTPSSVPPEHPALCPGPWGILQRQLDQAEGQSETFRSLSLSFPLWKIRGSEAVLSKDCSWYVAPVVRL